MAEKQFTLRMPSAHTVGVFMKNLVACLVVVLTIMGSVLYVQVHNEQNQIKEQTVIAKGVALKATTKAISAAEAASAKAGQGTSIALCTSLERLAALQPPSGASAANPSRLYEQKEHNILATLSTDLHCSAVVKITGNGN